MKVNLPVWAMMRFSLAGVVIAAMTTGGSNSSRPLRSESSTQMKLVKPICHYELVCPTRDYMLQDFDSGKEAVISPDRTKKIVLSRDGSLEVLDKEREVGKIRLPGISSNLEIIWAPDSRKFGVTYSDSGDEGAYHGHIYRLRKSGVTDVSKLVQVAFDDFKMMHYCQVRGNNEYVLGWGSVSNNVFVIAQVFPTGDCGQDFGKMGGYLMGLDGSILHRYGDKTTEAISYTCWKSGRVFVR